MYNTLALFALFAIGSADFQCDGFGSGGDANGKPCKNDTTNLIGACNNSQNCITTSNCSADGEKCGHPDTADFTGKCVKPSATATCFADSAIPVGQCAPLNKNSTHCEHANLIGTCNGQTPNLCITKAQCSTDDVDCGGNTGKCHGPSKTCQNKTITAGQCAAKDTVGTQCTNDNHVGTCDGGSTTNTCVITSQCSVEGKPCGSGTLTGKCVAAQNAGGAKCLYDGSFTTDCATGTGDTVPCRKNNLIGKCASLACVTDDQCLSAEDGKPCGSFFSGVCVGADKTCVPDVSPGKCAPKNASGTSCRHANLSGKCNGTEANNLCVTADQCASDGSDCASGQNFPGKCHERSKTCHVTGVDKGKCHAGDKANTSCTNGDLVGKCTGGLTANLCVTTDQCTVDGASCGNGTLTGKCVAPVAGPNTCFYDGSIADGKCAPGTGGLAFCKHGTFVGRCNGRESSSCVTDGQCSVDNRACGHLTDVALMGKCVGKDEKCYSLVGRISGDCVPGTSSMTYCKKGNLVGKCDGQSSAACVTVDQCEAAANDGEDCGLSSDYTLKGQCLPNKTCSSTADLGGKCATGTSTSSSCKKGGFLGLCAGSVGDCNITGAGSPCRANSTPYEVCTSATLKGWCDAASDAKCVPTGRCANDAQVLCKNDTLIGKCRGPSGNKVCVTAPGHAALCQDKKTEDACGNTKIASGFAGYCEAAEGNCKVGNPVKVAYKIQARPEELDTKEERVAFKSKVEGDNFKADLIAKMSRNASNTDIQDCTMQDPIANGEFDAGCRQVLNKNGQDTCPLTCTDSHKVKRVHTRKCSAIGTWIGVEGMCGLRCDKGEGEVSSDETAITFEGSTPEEGTLDCKSPASFQKVTNADSSCILSCPIGYRVRYASTRMCNSSTQWTGSRGSCELSTDVSASATFVLDDGDDHATIIGEADDMFNNKFKMSVAALLPGVSAENVIIVSIDDVTPPNHRRLNEKAVMVNYTIQVGESDPEGAHSPKNDSLLPVGGGLRGIR